jgi:hypothetical protein
MVNKEQIKTSSKRIRWARYFKMCKKPHYKADRTSGCSQYWYGADKRGRYMIRHSNHWGKVGRSIYLLSLTTSYNECVFTQFVTAKTYLQVNQFTC